MQPQYHFFSLSNAQLCPFAIAFKLLLDVDSVLLEIGNGQVNIADFVVVCVITRYIEGPLSHRGPRGLQWSN